MVGVVPPNFNKVALSLEEVLQPPLPTQRLWRYLTLGKFTRMLATKALWFPRVDLLGDPFEGSTPEFKVTSLRAALEATPGFRPEWLAGLGDSTRLMRRWLMASCWHASAHESDAMWRIYAPGDEGIAIQTTVADLTSALGSREDIHVGTVRYIDYATEWMPGGNVFYPPLHKRISFQHEHEVRALIWKPPIRADRSGLDFSAEPGFLGEDAPVALDTLIQEVRVAPAAPRWFVDAVQATLNAFALHRVATQSPLGADPSW